ncbi:MAG: hypothetical protein ACLQGU_08025 [bacterium]
MLRRDGCGIAKSRSGLADIHLITSTKSNLEAEKLKQRVSKHRIFGAHNLFQDSFQ